MFKFFTHIVVVLEEGVEVFLLQYHYALILDPSLLHLLTKFPVELGQRVFFFLELSNFKFQRLVVNGKFFFDGVSLLEFVNEAANFVKILATTTMDAPVGDPTPAGLVSISRLCVMF